MAAEIHFKVSVLIVEKSSERIILCCWRKTFQTKSWHWPHWYKIPHHIQKWLKSSDQQNQLQDELDINLTHRWQIISSDVRSEPNRPKSSLSFFTYPNIINQVQQWHKGSDHLDQLKVSQFECVEVKEAAFKACERSHTWTGLLLEQGHVLQTKQRLNTQDKLKGKQLQSLLSAVTSVPLNRLRMIKEQEPRKTQHIITQVYKDANCNR